MARPVWLLAALPLVAGACARVPADVSTPTAGDGSRPSERASATTATKPAAPIPGECVAAELEQCSAACYDAKCLASCGGEACVATVASLWACMDEAEQRFATEHPAPAVELQIVEVDGELLQEPTEASLAAQFEWEMAHEDTVADRWDQVCAARCVAALEPDASEPTGVPFCRDWRASYFGWGRLSQPPVVVHAEAGALASLIGTNSGLWASFSLGSSLTLAGALAERSDEPAALLAALVYGFSSEIAGVVACVPDLDDAGRQFTVAVELDERGLVVAADPIDGSPSDGRCVADTVAAALHLPVRVAREFPRLELRVHVQAATSMLGGDPWSSLTGVESDGWGGSGMTGVGVGGGGGGPGDLGGLGTTGSGGGSLDDDQD